jgi:2-oxoglutarate ferredoxin oxidoreductase subunit gamma
MSQSEKRFEIRLSGSGGQGLMLAGQLLAEAAAVFDGKNVVQTESYGPEARGGKSKTDVVVSDGEIDYPKATRVDVLLAMSQPALDEYVGSLRDGGMLIVDSYVVERIEHENAIRIPFTMLAIEECGRKLFANVVALGAIAELTRIVRWESLRSAVLGRVPKGTEQVNDKALEVGREAARRALQAGPGGTNLPHDQA